jgi:hypothetical protein
MLLMEKIVEGSSIRFEDETYKVVGRAAYSTRNEQGSTYTKIFLEGHHVLVIVPDEMIYFGVNKGHLPEFDSFGDAAEYDGKTLSQVNHDYQIRLSLDFGSPVVAEGNVEFWDYEAEGIIVSVAKVDGTNERADVVAKYISFDEIEVVCFFAVC